MTDLFIGAVVAGLWCVVVFRWGRRVGREQERERVQDQLYRLHKEGLVSADMRIILIIRLDPDYAEPVLTPRDRSE